MKKHFLPLAFLALAAALPGQQLLEIQHSCSFDGEERQTEFYAFDASAEADQIVGRIVKAVNLSKNFVVKSADCKNALATVKGRDRYILYNTTFLEKFKQDARTKWAAYCVLAHEIGHHLNNHDIETDDSKKRKIMELEADRFAGGVMFTLGATLDEAQAGIEMLQTQGESATHPPARARAEAIANGWKNSQENFRQINDQRDSDPPATQPDNNRPIVPPSPEKGQPDKGKQDSKLPQNTLDPGQKPTTETTSDLNFTEVSDLLMQQYIIGSWECSFYNGVGYVSNFSTFYTNGSAIGQSYFNGNFVGSIAVNWTISQGIYTQLNPQTGLYERYRMVFDGPNYMSATFVETNGVTNIPYGTTFNYVRRQ